MPQTGRGRHLTRVLFTSLLALATVAPAAAVASASGAPGVTEYVALGDSFSADVSLVTLSTEQVPLGCGQSSRNYPKQVAQALHVTV
ncbi:MAG: hypothetical protein ABI251_09265, partial [Mycobacteriaceae bacterium]